MGTVEIADTVRVGYTTSHTMGFCSHLVNRRQAITNEI